MNAGDKVSHAELGLGTIKQVYPEGPTALVDFGYMEELIPFDKLTWKESKEDTHTTETSKVEEARKPEKRVRKKTPVRPPEAVFPDLTESAIEARRAVVALRLGQVLESHVGDLSVGLDAQHEQLKAGLEKARNGSPVFIGVEGAWGGGKTHALTMLLAEASRAGFASSAVVMDGMGITLWDPMQLMEVITASLRFPGEVLSGGLTHHIAAAKKNDHLKKFGRRGSRILGGVFEQIPHDAFGNTEVLQMLEDYLSLSLPASAANTQLKQHGYRGITLPPLKARSLSDRADRFCDLLYDWTKLCVGSGAKGLVVALDELDVEYASTAWGSKQSEERRHRRSELFRALGKLRREKLPLVVAFAAAPAGPGIEVENDAVRDLACNIGDFDQHIVAPLPRESELRELSKKVLTLYRSAYPKAFDHLEIAGIDRIANLLVDWYKKQPNPVPRYFIRSALEVMDILSTA